MKVGSKAPSFSLLDGDEKKVELKRFKGKWIVLYFYPKDNTPGCTTEARDFTARKKDFEKLDAVVVGVSPDSTGSHCRFAEKQDLDITLLSDPDHELIEACGAWQLKKQYGREYYGVVRSTLLIDPKGVVVRHWPKVSVKGHADDVLEALREHRTKKGK